MSTDPFARPTQRVVTGGPFATVASFRGRLILVKPTKLEHDIPKISTQPNGPKGDRVTADITVVDGLGPVPELKNLEPTGVMVDGPEYKRVWIQQDQIVEGLKVDPDKDELHSLVLMRIDTLKPGTRPGQGNPWIVYDFSDEDAQTARDFLAGRIVSQAARPTPKTPAASANPFG